MLVIDFFCIYTTGISIDENYYIVYIMPFESYEYDYLHE